MKRREFIALVGGALAWPISGQAQQKLRVRRIGILMPYGPGAAVIQSNVRVFREELSRLGWSEGKNVQFDERWSTDNMDMVRADAASLVKENPDVILILGDRVIPVFKELTSSIPIVVAVTSDPIASGAADSLAHPGHNMTGFSWAQFSIFGKMLEILKQMAPGITRIGIMYNPDIRSQATFLPQFETSAAQLRLQPINLPVHDAAEIERAIASIADPPDGGIFLLGDVTVVRNWSQIQTLLARYRIPSIDPMPGARGLVSYGPKGTEMWTGSAGYVDRILRGEKAGDLPFQQPTVYRLVINLKTAKALGLTVPAELLSQADEVIE
jgi:putative tryptophan/tyrosine transport system substrate-binding protein